MTSNLLAEARAPLSISHPLPSHGDHQRSLNLESLGAPPQKKESPSEDDNIEIIDSRPVKRRKFSNSIDLTATASNTRAYNTNRNASARYSGAPWLSIVDADINEQTKERMIQNDEPPPLPTRPWTSDRAQDTVLDKGRPGCRVRKNVAVPTIPDSMINPPDAPKLANKKQADYFPWTGRHQEDILSNNHVTKGYVDAGLGPPDRELNTAKATLHNSFKSKAGIVNLSALFSLVLSQKDSYGSFSSVSTFKGPPPRVTLTEAKRKAWITDLSNPEIPLRRLSKTIPQGIRGQVLLEQSLLHSIPLSRAIWFAKCVGANEIRTLKRKGITAVVVQGAEAKWLREWTINVEQFVEQILTQCGRINWRKHIQYAIQLTARLYAENLLDRDHYLDWIVKSMTSANINQWPFWLMLAGIYRLDLLHFRKRAKQLAEILVIKYNLACKQLGNTLEPLAQKIKQAIRMCFLTRPACFLMPEMWFECEKALAACIDNKVKSELDQFERIKISNKRTMGANRHDRVSNQPSKEHMIEILDTAHAPFNVPDICAKLLTISPEPEHFIRTSLEWAISCYRTGVARIYLVSRLLRKWCRQGYDFESLLFRIVFSEADPRSLDVAALRHLISELSRSRTLSTSKLFQWLAVRGLPTRNIFSTVENIHVVTRSDSTAISIQACSDPVQVLTEICLVNAGVHIENSRNAMLERSGYHTRTEGVVLDACKEYLSQLIHNPQSNGDTSLTKVNFACLPWSIRTQLSHWLRAQTVAMVQTATNDSPNQLQFTAASLNVHAYSIIRQSLELLGDLAILADVLQIAAGSKQEDLLATMVDTANRHSQAFSAIGALEPLQKLFGQAFLTLRPVKTSMPLLSTALIDLCQQYPIKITPIKALQQEFVRGDRGRAIAACSPFSDGVAESLQQAGATFYDDFEAILQTESNMNEQTMTQLFNVLVDRILKIHDNNEEDGQCGRFILCQLLCRLKTCRKLHGEMLMKKWLLRIAAAKGYSINSVLLFDLVSSRCVQLGVLIDVSRAAHISFKRALTEAVQLAMDDQISGDPSVIWYSMRLAVSQLAHNNPAELLGFLDENVLAESLDNYQNRCLAVAIIIGDNLQRTLSEQSGSSLSRKLSKALGTYEDHDDVARQMIALAQNAGPLSLPFCQFSMQKLCQKLAGKDAETSQTEIADMLCARFEADSSTLVQSPATFQALMQAMGPVIEAKIKWKIELAFFQALPRFLQSKLVVQPALTDVKEAELAATSALRRVTLVNANTAAGSQPGIISTLIEKLTIYLKYLGPTQNTGLPPNVATSSTQILVSANGPGSTTIQPDALRSFALTTIGSLGLLLQMVCIKRTTLYSGQTQPSPTSAKQNQQEQIKLLGLVISIATQPVWSGVMTDDITLEQQHQVRNVTEMMFDVAATLVDDMAEEPRMLCMRLLKEKVKDERVRWLMGSVNVCGSAQFWDAGQGLQIYHETKGVIGDFRPKVWEMLENGGTAGEGCLGLGLFGASEA